MPPSIAEIDAFLADDSEHAYENLVDVFLSQDSYGERMAMEWLDLARYADSHGYQDDIERSMWPWRDWVINAFNKNMPYNQFVAWQLAGDLMPEASYDQKLATGFNRNHKITQEVGVIDEEYRVTYVLDRVNTFSTAFLGLTVECAQCHDHKYDPISQKDYYSLFSFFNNVPEKGRVDYGVEVANPSLALPDKKVEELKNYIQDLVTSQHQKLNDYATAKWNKPIESDQLRDAIPSSTTTLTSGLVAWYPLDYLEDDKVEDIVSKKYGNTINELIPVQGKFSGGVEFMGTNYADLQPSKYFNFQKPFTISIWIKSLDGGIRGRVLSSRVNKSKSNFFLRVNNEKHVSFYLGNYKNKSKIQFTSKETLPENEWVQTVITYNGSGKANGLKLYFNGKLIDVYVQSDDLRGGLPSPQNLYLGRNGPKEGLLAAQVDELMLFNRPLNGTEVQNLYSFNPLSEIADKKQLTDTDKNTVRSTFVLNRGQYDQPGVQVFSSTPKAILEFDDQYSKNRLGLADWLFHDNNPLTARVAVNRYWQMIFGQGIVSTPGDFGSQGALPSHPELLDWLAADFVDEGWSCPQLISRQ